MKIGIITLHFCDNYGAVLQCLALNKVIKGFDHEVSIIDYRPYYHTRNIAVVVNPFWKANRAYKNRVGLRPKITAYIRTFLGCCYKNVLYFHKRYCKRKLFDEFRSAHMKYTMRYSSFERLAANPPRFDAYVSGSDQLWRYDLTNDAPDPAYFLEFGDPAVKRVTYAVSFNRDTLSQGDLLKEHAKALDAISIRERTQKNMLAQILQRDIYDCIDPSLYLDMDEYKEYEREIDLPREYVFVYVFGNNPGIDRSLESLRRHTDMEFVYEIEGEISVTDEKHSKRCTLGPREFLYALRNASFVLTNSYHGMALSIVFKKEFVALKNITDDARLTDLANRLALNQRIARYGDNISELYFEKTDYTKAYELLEIERRNGYKYLREELS